MSDFVLAIEKLRVSMYIVCPGYNKFYGNIALSNVRIYQYMSRPCETQKLFEKTAYIRILYRVRNFYLISLTIIIVIFTKKKAIG